MVVREYRNGHGGVIRIHDDCLKSKEEQELIIKQMTERIQRCLVARMITEEEAARQLQEDKQKGGENDG